MGRTESRHGLPWETWEIRKLGTATDRAIGKQLGRRARAVESQRRERGVAAHTLHQRRWSPAELRLLGKMPDAALAKRLGIWRRTVLCARQRRGIAAYSAKNRPRQLDPV